MTESRITAPEADVCPFCVGDALVCDKPTNFHRVGEVVIVEGLDRRYASDTGPFWVRLIGKPGHYSWQSFRRASGSEVAAALAASPPPAATYVRAMGTIGEEGAERMLYAEVRRLPAALGVDAMSEQQLCDLAEAQRSGAVALADDPDHFHHLIEFTPPSLRTFIASLPRPSPAAPGVEEVAREIDAAFSRWRGRSPVVHLDGSSYVAAAVLALLPRPSPEVATAPSVSGVRIKPLKWQDGGLNDLVAKTQFGGEWRIRELPRYLPWELTVHDMDGEHVDCRTLDEAKAAAQADYEARIRASITSEATPIAGENE